MARRKKKPRAKKKSHQQQQQQAAPPPSTGGVASAARSPPAGAAAAADTATQEHQPPEPPRERDEEKAVKKLVFKHNGVDSIDFERLVKRMPKAAQQLKEGTTTVDEVSFELISTYLQQTSKVASPETICAHLTMLGWPVDLDFNGDEFPQSADAALIEKFASDLDERLSAEVSKFMEAHGTYTSYEVTMALEETGAMKMAYEQTCRSWSKRLDRKYFNGKTGTFLRSCPMYGLTEEEWNENLVRLATATDDKEAQKHFSLELAKVNRDAALAAQAVTLKLDEVWTNCWECGIAVKDLKVCSRCSVARYCSRECQVAAWHASHKTACPDHKTHYAAFLEDLRIVDEVHETGTVHGFYPNENIDYRRALLTQWYRRYMTSAAEGPSMKFFFKNIGHIVRGDWWIHQEPDSPEDYAAKIENSAASPLAEICRLLSYDLHGYAEACKDGIVTSEAIESILVADSDVMKFDAKMPAEIFIEWYGCHDDKKLSDPHSRKKLSALIKAGVIKQLRNDETGN